MLKNSRTFARTLCRTFLHLPGHFLRLGISGQPDIFGSIYVYIYPKMSGWAARTSLPLSGFVRQATP